MVGRHAVGDAGRADLRLRAHDALRERLFRDEERAGDLAGRQAADETQCQRHLRVRRKRRMAAREDERQSLVRDDRLVVHRFLRLLLQLGDELGQASLSAQAVDRLAPRGHREPRAGARGNPGARPRDERGRQRVLERVFRKVDVAQVANQRRDHAPVLGAEDRLDSPYIAQTGRTSTEPCSAAGIFAAYVSASSMLSHSRT